MRKSIEATRTYRKFDADHFIESQILTELIDLGRLAGSARNCQPWKYLPVNESDLCDQIFPHLGWAGYLSDWKGPEKSERPTGYILCFLKREWLKGSDKEAYFDLGISSQNILLGATERGLGGCRIASFSPKLSSLFTFTEKLELHLVIALGSPAEKVVLEQCSGEDVAYWRDDKMVHHVPKRLLQDILLKC